MQYDETIQNEIENLLRQKIGLNPESVGSRSILRAVKKGMRMGKMQGLSDYLTSLQDSPEQFESLIESVVVPETSFFRNRASF
ncbi:MAG: chemotaxis protein, partial [Cyanobacteria bacterium J06606_4]